MDRTRPWWHLVVALIAVTGVAAACSGGDDEGSAIDDSAMDEESGDEGEAAEAAETTTTETVPDTIALDEGALEEGAEDEGDDAATTTTAAPTTTGQPTTTQPATTSTAIYELADGAGCTPGFDGALPDGRWYGFVTMMTETSVEFDLACHYSGSAVSAAGGTGATHVTNENDTLRTVAVAAEANVTWYPSMDPADEVVGTYADWMAGRAEVAVADRPGVWLDTVSGAVVIVTEELSE